MFKRKMKMTAALSAALMMSVMAAIPGFAAGSGSMEMGMAFLSAITSTETAIS